MESASEHLVQALQRPIFRERIQERLMLVGWGQMWYTEEICKPHVYRRTARCVSKSQVEGDKEIIGLNSTVKGH